jgi:RNA polymerase sigma-70 factor, ECF subfamily
MTDRDFRQAFREHKDAVYGFAYRMSGSEAAAEDLAQDCFLELLRHPDRFDASRGTLRAFLLGVTRNLALKRWRTEHRFDALDGEDELAAAVAPASAEAEEMVRAAVASLPPLQREAILLFEYEGLTLGEIAAVTSVDIGAVKARLHRGREKLRQALKPLRNGTGGH